MPKSDNKSVGFPAMFLNVRPKSFYHSGPLVSISAYTPSPVGTKQCSHGREPMDSVARKTGEPRRAEGAKGPKGRKGKRMPEFLSSLQDFALCSRCSMGLSRLTPMATTFRHFVATQTTLATSLGCQNGSPSNRIKNRRLVLFLHKFVELKRYRIGPRLKYIRRQTCHSKH